MSSRDKMLLICLIGICIGFIIAIYDAYKYGYEKGHRVGWHKGRAVNRQEFWQE